MYDIHCHIFPAVDDGSGSFNDSVEMACIAASCGVKSVVATPHCNVPGMFENYWNARFEETLRNLNEALVFKGIPITVYKGQEIFAHGDIVSGLRNGDLITLNGSRYVLIEFDFDTSENEAIETVKKIKSEGYVPIVAHPERYGFVFENPVSIKKICSSGGLIQLNSGSIKGSFGPYVQKLAGAVLKSGVAHFVASDAHSQFSRTPDITEAHEIVCNGFSYDYAKLLFENNPLRVINDEEIW